MSVVSYLEVIEGVRDRRELREVRDWFEKVGFRLLPLSREIGERAMRFMEEHTLSSGLGAADSLTAATAVLHGMSLVSGNRKHIKAVGELRLTAFLP